MAIDPSCSAGLRVMGEAGRLVQRGTASQFVVGDPRHPAGVDIRTGEVDPRRVEGLSGATVGHAVQRNDGPGLPDVVGRVRPTGVVALQLIEIGKDVPVELRFDRAQVSDNPAPGWGTAYGKPSAVQREILCGCRNFLHCALGLRLRDTSPGTGQLPATARRWRRWRCQPGCGLGVCGSKGWSQLRSGRRC